MSVLFAAAHPERTRALVLYGTFARSNQRDWSPERFDARMVEFDRGWGTTMSRLPMLAPGKLSDAAFSRAWTRLERQSASPAAAIAMLRMNKDIDVSHVLPVIRVPTLVLHRTGDLTVNVDQGRYLAAHLPGARYVEMAGHDHLVFVGDGDRCGVTVTDVDAKFQQALDAGATVVAPLDDQFWGDRYGVVEDPFGHHWSLGQPVREVSPEDIQAAMSGQAG